MFEANVTKDDAGTAIVGEAQCAYDYLNSAFDKNFRMIRIQVDSDAAVGYRVGASVDFEANQPLGAMASVVTSGTKWGWGSPGDPDYSAGGKWNSFKWAGGTTLSNEWHNVDKSGTAISVRLGTETRGARVSWYASDILYEPMQGIIG